MPDQAHLVESVGYSCKEPNGHREQEDCQNEPLAVIFFDLQQKDVIA